MRTGDPERAPETLESRLRTLALRLRRAADASRSANHTRLAGVIVECAGQAERAFANLRQRRARTIERVIARGERALVVWQTMSSF